jgi:hypothetical protein
MMGTKRRRLSGSSRWTLSSISRQIVERQANDDADDMLLQQNTPNSSGGYPHEEESQVLNSVTSVSENNDCASMNIFEKVNMLEILPNHVDSFFY